MPVQPNNISSTIIRMTIVILKRSLSLIISGLILALLLDSAAHMIDLKKVAKNLLSMDVRSICLLLLLMVFTFFVNTYRFAVIAKWVLTKRITYYQSLKITWLGCFLALSTPFAAFGDIARAGLIKWIIKEPIRRAIQIVLFDRGFSLLCLIVFALVSSIACTQYLSQSNLLLSQVIVPSGSLLALAIILLGYRKLNWPDNRICAFLKDTLDKLSFLLSQPVYIMQQLFISFLNILIYVLTFLVLAHAMHFSFNAINLLLFTPLMLVINNLPFFYLGLGGREAIFLLLMPLLAPAANSNTLLAASLGYGVLTMVVSLFGGVYLFGIYKQKNLFVVENLQEHI